ncbi:MAG: antibiotic biosynthesis monooxygenase family protein [Chitinophagaceae bacterium]
MIRIVRMHFKEGYIEHFQREFEQRYKKIRHADGCQYLALWQDENDKQIFYTYSIWQSPQHLENYRHSALFNETWSIVKPWFESKAQAFSANEIMHLS